MAKLTLRQKTFIDEYMIDFNGAQAAIRAGYSPRTAREQACDLLTRPHIQDELSRRMALRSRRTGVNQDRVLYELAKIAFLNPIDVIDMDKAAVNGDASRDDTAAIHSVKVKTIPTEDGDITEREVKTYDKLKALELLGRHLGMFSDNKKEQDAKNEAIEIILRREDNAKNTD